jgi:hypothetical protein
MYQVKLHRGKNPSHLKKNSWKYPRTLWNGCDRWEKKINIIGISSFVLIWGALVSGRGRYLSNWWSKNTEESDKYFTRKTASTHATELLNTIATSSYSVYRVPYRELAQSEVIYQELGWNLVCVLVLFSNWLLFYREYIWQMVENNNNNKINIIGYLLWHSCNRRLSINRRTCISFHDFLIFADDYWWT